MDVELRAASSSSPGHFYAVTFKSDDKRVWVLCECAAGASGQFCKHRRAFISGDASLLWDDLDTEVLATLQAEPDLAPAVELLRLYDESLAQIEREKKGLKEREKALKSRFAVELLHGIALPL